MAPFNSYVPTLQWIPKFKAICSQSWYGTWHNVHEGLCCTQGETFLAQKGPFEGNYFTSETKSTWFKTSSFVVQLPVVV